MMLARSNEDLLSTGPRVRAETRSGLSWNGEASGVDVDVGEDGG
jgi:hypothetical protein